MIILDATTKTLEIVLGGAVATNQLPVQVAYADITTTTFDPKHNDTASNSTTPVTITSAPAASTQRQIKTINVYNRDTASATVTIQYNNNGTTRILVKIALAVDSTLFYTDTQGWRVISTAGVTL